MLLEQRLTVNSWWEIHLERQVGSILFMALNGKLVHLGLFLLTPLP